DWRKDKNDKEDAAPFIIDGLGLPAAIPGDAINADGWNRGDVKLIGGKVRVTVNGKVALADQPLPSRDRSGPPVLRLINPGHPVTFCNLMWTEAAAKRP